MCRDSLYEATCDVPGFQEGFREQEKAIIELRSKFMPGEGVDYLLDLLSRINKENGVTTRDNGVSQEVEARQGISLKALVQVKPRISMRPYRTFLEVEQPESEFMDRCQQGPARGCGEGPVRPDCGQRQRRKTPGEDCCWRCLWHQRGGLPPLPAGPPCS